MFHRLQLRVVVEMVVPQRTGNLSDHPLPSIGLVKHTTGPFSRVYNHLPITATNHYFRPSWIHIQSFVKKGNSPVRYTSTRLLQFGAIRTKYDAYSNSEGRPLLDSLETTTNSSGLITDPYWKPTFTIQRSVFLTIRYSTISILSPNW